jgi:ABC-2 type transport system permease protein
MIKNIILVTARIYKQLWGDKRFLALAVFVPLFIIYLFKVFIQEIPLAMFTDPHKFYVLITAFIIHFTSYVLCLIVIVRERREGTLIRMAVTNYSRVEIVAGYVIGYAGLATLQAILILLEVDYFFNLNYGTVIMLKLFGILWTLSIISISLGIIISNLAKTEAQIFPLIPLFALPTIFLSGLIVQIERISWLVRWISYFLPLTYALRALEIIIPGVNMTQNDDLISKAGELNVLFVYGLALLAICVLTLKEYE